MIKIAVCDGVPQMAQQLVKIIRKHIKSSKLKYEISDVDINNDADSIVSCAGEYNIIFLDIDMPGIDGIEAGRLIRKVNPDVIIIIASERAERFKETYGINALRFINKPYDEEELTSVLTTVEEKISGLKTIRVYKKRFSVDLMQKDIMYIEAYEGAARIHTRDGEYRRDESLSSLENRLDSRFFVRINRSYIVNLKWIIKYNEGIMKIGKCRFRVSRGNRKYFEYLWMKYGL